MKAFFLVFFLNLFLFANKIDVKYLQGEQLYLQTCVSCHGIDGRADTNLKLIVKPRDLTKTILDENQIYLITKDGARFWGAKSDIMPAFKYTFNDEQLRSVSYYISKKFNPNNKKRVEDLYNQSESISKEKVSRMLEYGKKVYFRNCIYCHGLYGEGDGEATKNPVDSIFPYNLKKTLLTKEQMFLYIKYGGSFWGTDKDDMPAWKVKYDDFTLKSTAEYVDTVIRGN